MGVEVRGGIEEVAARAAALRRILDGGEVDPGSDDASAFRLVYPPCERVPIYLAAMQPRMLRFAGRFADGVLLSWIKGPSYVAWARAQVEAGSADAGRAELPRIVSFAVFAVDDDPQLARADVRAALLSELARGPSKVTDAAGFSQELEALLATHGVGGFEQHVPDRWFGELAIAGDPDDCAAGITQHLDAGADAVVLCPAAASRASGILDLAASQVLPRLQSKVRIEAP
jgi:alkanesulfonate monooxygenase SsuD/methylene tetrahydromethanopterin reductase-like flavin-dependent oxidoreductase (luciferase family)